MAMAFVLANTSFANHGIQAINGHTMELDGDDYDRAGRHLPES